MCFRMEVRLQVRADVLGGDPQRAHGGTCVPAFSASVWHCTGTFTRQTESKVIGCHLRTGLHPCTDPWKGMQVLGRWWNGESLSFLCRPAETESGKAARYIIHHVRNTFTGWGMVFFFYDERAYDVQSCCFVPCVVKVMPRAVSQCATRSNNHARRITHVVEPHRPHRLTTEHAIKSMYNHRNRRTSPLPSTATTRLTCTFIFAMSSA